jgi:shikimate dehydrogenase
MFSSVKERTGLNLQYENLVVPSDYYDKVLEKLVTDEDVIGFNVTIPYKVKIVDSVIGDEDVKNCGAVNCVKVDHNNGLFYGYNTDWKGIYKPLKKKKIKTAIVVGAGGAARAACYALEKLGVENISVFNRSQKKAASLNSVFHNLKIYSLENLDSFIQKNETDLLINTTPLGMNPNPWTSLPVTMETLKNCRIVFDVVYKPLKTKLLVYAENSGCELINGLEMLVDQHIENVKIWDLPKKEEIIKILELYKKTPL